MMEIQIIQDLDDECSNNKPEKEHSSQHMIQSGVTVTQSKDTDGVSKDKLVGSYFTEANEASGLADDILHQVANGQNEINGIFSNEKRTNDSALHETQDVVNVIASHSKSTTLADGHVQENLLLRDNGQNSSVDESFDVEKARYVILSRSDASSSVITSAADGDAQQFTLTLAGDDAAGSFQNMPDVNVQRDPGGDGLNMIFEVVGEISSPGGQVFMREIATQTNQSPKQRCIARKRKISDSNVDDEESEENSPAQSTNEKRFKCKSCGLKFFNEETRDVHQKCHKGSMRDYYCYFCDFSAPQWTKMHLHLFTHGVEKPYKCDQCSFTCKNKSDLTAHATVHSDLKQFMCTKCGRRYKHRRNVVAHLRTCSGVDETGKPQRNDNLEKFICKVCHRTLSTKKNLDKHMEIHTNIKPYVCKTCGHATRLKESLVMHERLHTGEKPFKCNMCVYATPDKSSLRRHIRTHTKEKPYKCKFCSYSSIQKHCLDTHVRRKHTGEQFVCGLCHYATHDRYGLNQHFKRHQNPDGTISQSDLENLVHGNQRQQSSSFLNAVEDTGTTYVGLPQSAFIKHAPEANKQSEDSQKRALANPVILRIAHASTQESSLLLQPASMPSERGNGSNIALGNGDTVPINRPQEASVDLAEIEATLVQQIQQPGDEVFIQPTGEIIIKRQDGHLLVIQRRDDLETELDLDDVADQDYYAAVPLSDISPEGDAGVGDEMADNSEELQNAVSAEKVDSD